MGRLEAAGFDGDVLDFGTPARRSAVLLRPTADGAQVEAPGDCWTPFERPVAFQNSSCGCLVLGLDDVELLRFNEPSSPRLRVFVRSLAPPRTVPGQGIALVDGVLVWVAPEADARELLAMLHGLLFEEMVRALHEDRLDDVNPLAWRLWRASVSVEEKAVAIAGLERSRYPEHARLVLGKPATLSASDRLLFEGVLFHARQGLDWAVRLCARRQAS